MQIIFHPKSLEYKGTLGNPDRLILAHSYLKNKFKFLKPELKISEPIVHSKELIQKVETRNFYDADSPAYENIFDYALVSVNASVKAQELQGFALIDPPGHHAGKNFLGGFCYFNNIAEAILRSELKTLIIDIDGHHGNGTQEIFENNPDVFFISLHRKGIYPGTGFDSYENIINSLLDHNCNEEIYLQTLENSIMQALKNFHPEQIAVSAGFDTYRGDLASLNLKKESYFKIAKLIKKYQKQTKSKIFAVLEGGYSEELGELIEEFIRGFDKN